MGEQRNGRLEKWVNDLGYVYTCSSILHCKWHKYIHTASMLRCSFDECIRISSPLESQFLGGVFYSLMIKSAGWPDTIICNSDYFQNPKNHGYEDTI